MALTKQTPRQFIKNTLNNYTQIQGCVTKVYGLPVVFGPVNTAVSMAVGTICHYGNFDPAKNPIAHHALNIALLGGNAITSIDPKAIAQKAMTYDIGGKREVVSIQNFIDAHNPKK